MTPTIEELARGLTEAQKRAVMTNDSGAVTAFCSPFCSHAVRIDIESLPTGIVIPNSGHNSIPTALTVS